MKNLRLIAAFLIAPLAAPVLAGAAIMLPYLDDLSGIFMVQWIIFVLLTPFSYLATFFFGILASTVLKDILLKNRNTLLLSGAIYGMLTMFILCYLTPFFSRNFLFVIGGAGMGLAVAYIFSFIAEVPQEKITQIASLQETKQ